MQSVYVHVPHICKYMYMYGICTHLQGVPELHYLHRRWPKARPLSKLRGTPISAVAWPPLPLGAGVGGEEEGERESGAAGGAAGEPQLSEGCTGWVCVCACVCVCVCDCVCDVCGF